MSDADLINDLQTRGMRLVDPPRRPRQPTGRRRPLRPQGGDHRRTTVMVPVHTAPAFDSPYLVEAPDATGAARG